MTFIYSASPGTASRTFNKNLEYILNDKCRYLKSGSGIGHLLLTIPIKRKILKFLKLDFLDKTSLIQGHIFPTKFNLDRLFFYYDVKHIIISYRNIYEQLNYFYKWQKYKLRGPLNFPEDTLFSNKNEFHSNNFNIDLNLLLVLNFYKHWFYIIQNNKLKNITLFSFEEITCLNESYQKKIKDIFGDKVNLNKIQLKKSQKNNFINDENFKINKRHDNLIKDFISFHKEIDFGMIL